MYDNDNREDAAAPGNPPGNPPGEPHGAGAGGSGAANDDESRKIIPPEELIRSGKERRDEDRPAEDEDESDAGRRSNKTRMELYDWLQCIVSAILCGIFIFVFIGRTIGVEGDSMRETLHWNDRVIMSDLFYTPKNGDIIVFRPQTDAFGGTPLVKRIIAMGGQTIDINFDTGDVTVDGKVLNEPYIFEPTHNRLNFQGPLTIPDGYVFVMGDNRNHSSDSRDSRVGLVDTRDILGKVLFIAIPGVDEYTPRDWSRIGLVNHGN